MENVKHFVGVDISKRTIDLALHAEGKHIQIENNQKGFRQMFAWFKEHKVSVKETFLVMEHTGLYSFCFEDFLEQKEIPYSKVSALQIKLSSGIVRGKSDRIDAKRIAHYAMQKSTELKAYTKATKALEALKLLNTSRDNLVRSRAGLKNSVEEFRNIGLSDRNPALKAQLKVIDELSKQIAAVETEMKRIIQSEEKLEKNYTLLTSIKGVGFVVATTTIIKTHNFERFANARKFCCFAGIAPFENRSGTSIRGKNRVNHLADKGMKTCLDLAAKSAITCDPELKAYYANRTEKGKSKMGTLNVIRNKIVGRMFAVIKRQSPYMTEFRSAA